MSFAEEGRPTARTAFVYTPKWELWYNGLIWQAVFNVINSFNIMEYGQLHVSGVNIPQSKATTELFIERVRVLQDLILPGWADNEYEKAMKTLNKTDEREVAHEIFRAILGLLHRRGNIRFKPPRDPAD